MTEKAKGVGAERAYAERTAELRSQLAGLELVLHIRRVIESVLWEWRYGGHVPDSSYRLHFRGQVLQSNKALKEILSGKSLRQQKELIHEALSTYADEIPAYHLEDSRTLDGREQHVVLVCAYTM